MSLNRDSDDYPNCTSYPLDLGLQQRVEIVEEIIKSQYNITTVRLQSKIAQSVRVEEYTRQQWTEV